MATLLFSSKIMEIYKETADVISSVELLKKDVREKSLKDLMQESFFHGASRFGYNFIS